MEFLSTLGVPIVIVALAFAFLGVIIFVSRNYMRCPPNEVLILYGRQHRFVGDDGKPVSRGYRLITGGAAFRIPLLERAQWLSLNVFPIPVRIENTPNNDGVRVTVDSVANVRISSNPALLGSAVEQFLGKEEGEIHKIVHDTLEGLVRQLVGTLTIEAMVRERESISRSVLHLTEAELSKLGFVCQTFVVSKIDDEHGYIEAMGKKKTAEVMRDAEIGEAEAKREATIKASAAKREGEAERLANEAKIADANRDLEVKKATYDAEIKAEQARAALAGDIAKAERSKELKLREVAVQQTEVEAMTAVAEKAALRREKELVAEKIKPAEAERQAVLISAEGVRNAAVVRAEGEAKAEVTLAEAAATATKARAEAEKVKLAAEGEGHAAAEAALKRQAGLAEAEVTKAKGEAEGAAIRAKLLAEAEGIEKKNLALAQMSDGARLILVLERMPDLIDETGEALAKALAPAFQAMGAGIAGIDKIQIVDMGGSASPNGSSAVERLALSIPNVVFSTLQKAKALGVDLDKILGKLGIRVTEEGVVATALDRRTAGMVAAGTDSK